MPSIPRFLSSPGNQGRNERYRWAPGLTPAPLADMAADELSQSLSRSPAARVAETPLAFPPRLPLRTPPGWPAGGWRPATVKHRARVAREEAERADNHRVRVRTNPDGASLSSVHSQALGVCASAETEVREKSTKTPSFACAVWSVYFHPL